MTGTIERVIRIAGRGDGLTDSGRYVPLAAPGDVVRIDPAGAVAAIEPGPEHVQPPCRHFPECGGCTLQHVSDAAYVGWMVGRTLRALEQKGIAPPPVEPPHLSPPRTRRRATLRMLSDRDTVRIGFNAPSSHAVINMCECHILAPALFALVEPLRRLFAGPLRANRSAGIALALTAGGPDLLLSGVAPPGAAATRALAAFAGEQGLARLSIDTGLGPEPIVVHEPPIVLLGGVPVAFPPGGFLQATADGEAALVAAVLGWTDGAPRVADLFCGLGTFALPLSGTGPASRRVDALDGARDATAALEAAARGANRRVAVEHRDLFRRPLTAAELKRFDAVVLDPPRAGASAQAAELARSAVPRVVAVSCNPGTFARDAAILTAGDYRLAALRVVGQFRWSTHLELAALFER